MHGQQEQYQALIHEGQQRGKHNLPKALINTLLGFDLETYQNPLDTLMPSKCIRDGVISSRKYKQVVSSIHESA